MSAVSDKPSRGEPTPLQRVFGSDGGMPNIASPLAQRPHGKSRWHWIGALTGVALAIAWGEQSGWPWLVQPAASLLSESIAREVDVQGERQARVHLWGGVRLSAPQLRIGAPPWADQPWFLTLHDGELALGYGALWRMARGGAIEIERLRASRLQAWMQRLPDGRASWQMGHAAQNEPEQAGQGGLAAWQQLRIQDMVLQQGVVHVDDAVLGIQGRLGVSVVPTRGAQAWQWAVEGLGKRGAQTVALQAHSTQPWAWQGERRMALQGHVGAAHLRYSGLAPNADGALEGAFRLSGPSLASVGAAVGVTLPTTGAFDMSGRVSTNGPFTQVNVARARIGDSRLSGEFTHTRATQPPTLVGLLRGRRLALADLGPAVGVPATQTDAAEPTARVLPDRPFNLPSLAAMNANVKVSIDVFETGVPALQDMRELRGRIRLTDSVLRIEQLSTQLAKGRVSGLLELDARRAEQAVLRADLDLDGVDVSRWVTPLQRPGQDPYLSGVLQGRLDVVGRGRSTAELLGSLNGQADLTLHRGQVSHLGVELAGVDLMEGLLQWAQGDESLTIQCAQLRLLVRDGVVRPTPVIVSTDDSTLWVDGNISLKDESLDVRTRVAPKDFSLVALRTPVQVKGPWRDVDVKVFHANTWAKIAGAAALATLHPAAAIVPLIDAGQQDAARDADQRCRQAQLAHAERAR